MAEEVDVQIQPLLDDDELNEMGSFAFEPTPHKRRVPIWLIVVIVLLVLALAGGGLTYWLLNRKQPVQYTQSAATVGNISTTIAATGPLSANAIYNLNFPVSGTISEIDVQIGQQVKQGQTLAKITIDKTQMQDTINQDQLAVTGAQQALDAQQTALSNAQNGLGNTQAQNAAALKVAFDTEQSELAACNTQATSTVKPGTGTGTAPQATATAEAKSAATTLTQCNQAAADKYAQAQTQLSSSNTTSQNSVSSAQQQVASAQNNLDKANQTLQTAKDTLDTANGQAVLTSPTAATVAAMTGVVGQSTGSSSGSSGSAASTSTSASTSSSSGFITLVDTAKYTITAQVNEADIGNVQVNQPAKFTLSAFPSLTFRATVSNIGIIGATSSNVVTYPVLLTVDMSSLNNAHVYPGMTATVNITTAQRIGALLIPAAALTFLNTALQANEISRSSLTSLTTGGAAAQGTGTGSTGSTRIVVTLKNGQLTPILITTGLTSGQSVEVLSGIKEGDQVVVSQTGGATSTTTRVIGGGGAGGFGGGGGGAGGAGGFGGGGGGGAGPVRIGGGGG